MEQFSLEKWLQDKSRKVVTRRGNPVRIVCWDKLGGDYPIIACIKYDKYEDFETYTIEGSKFLYNSEDPYDLFFADEENTELTEFEKELQIIISEASRWTSDDGSMSTYWQFGDKEIKKISTQLLDLARNEIEKENRDGKQKPTDKIGPKFKVGDWVVNKNGQPHIFQVTKRSFPDSMLQEYGSTEGFFINTLTLDKQYRPWTIQDAKDGDVLYMDNRLSTCTFIYKSINNTIIQKYASYNKFGFEGRHYLVLNDGYVCPATKEQRDLLFQKMKEAGYEWDAEKKELKKIEQVSTWNEKIKGLNELETYILSLVPDRSLDAIKVDAKNIRYIINKEQPAEWSRQSIIGVLTKWLTEKIAPLHKKSLDGTINEREEMFKAALIEMRSFVNSPGFQIGKDTSAEWSEEDKRYRKRIVERLEDIRKSKEDNVDVASVILSEINWLKSIKPQPKYQWTDEDEKT